MAKSRKQSKKSETNISPDCVADLGAHAIAIADVNIPSAISDRFTPQIERVTARLNVIATNMQKAIEHEATKSEREAKAAERKAAKVDRLTKQIAAAQKKLEDLNFGDKS